MGNNYNQGHLPVTLNYLFLKLSKLSQISLFNNAFYLILTNVVVSLFGFVFWNVMARLFEPSQVGIGSALIASSGLIAELANLGLAVGLIRYLPETHEKAGKLINSSFTLTTGVALIGSIIYIIGINYWSPSLSFLQKEIWFSVLFIIFTIVTCLFALTDRVLIAWRAARYVFLKNILNCFIKIPASVFASFLLGGFGIFFGVGLGFFTGVLLALFLFIPIIYKGYYPYLIYEKELMHRVLPYSFINYLATLLNKTPIFIYPLMVLNVLGSEESAYFYIAWMITSVLSIIPNRIAHSLLAEGSHAPNNIGRDGKRAISFALVISLPSVGIMILLGGWFLHFFGQGYAEEGVNVIRLLALAVIPECINLLFLAVNQVKKRVHIVIAQSGMLSVIALGMGYWLLGKIGLIGIGIAYTFAHLIVAIFVIGPLWRQLSNKHI